MFSETEKAPEGAFSNYSDSDRYLTANLNARFNPAVLSAAFRGVVGGNRRFLTVTYGVNPRRINSQGAGQAFGNGFGPTL